MRDEHLQYRLHNGRKISTLLTKPTIYASLLLLSFVIGYLSSSSMSADSDHYRFATRCARPEPPSVVRTKLMEAFYNGSSPYDDFPPKHVAPFLDPAKINGWDSNNAVFGNLIRRYRPKTIIEVGSFLGMSAIHMAEMTQRMGLNAQIVCVDNFRAWPGLDIPMINGDVMLMYQFIQNLVHKNVTESILFLPYSTDAALEKMCQMGLYGDMIEIDAAHDFHSAWVDVNRGYKLLSHKGVIFGHDYFNPTDQYGVRRAVDLFARVKGLRVRTDGQHWVIDPN
ncbi:uncharacterized protein LOC124937431 [Impatiens glandulifera]|uniref:uncharacterized protein LOC124937431 n=1 Tax=Impatiens glandulifera TaxID=253017 RepID=UPI001FB0DDF7|nr:uncharacterized protein LOC124937431 [Impatiens glandulifera]